MNKKEIILNFHDELIKIFHHEQLTSLRGLNGEYEVNGKNMFLEYSNVTFKCKQKFPDKFDELYHLIADLGFCSDELLYFTGHLYLYKDFINNPLNRESNLNGKFYPNYQTVEDIKYSIFIDVAFQSAYNYWNRIGNLIACYFPKEIGNKKIYFSNAVDCISSKFHKSQNYTWLKEFKQNEYKNLNITRKNVVHNRTSNTEFNKNHLANVRDKDEIEKWQKEREDMPDFFKSHIKLSIDGFEKTLLLLEEISTVIF